MAIRSINFLTLVVASAINLPGPLAAQDNDPFGALEVVAAAEPAALAIGVVPVVAAEEAPVLLLPLLRAQSVTNPAPAKESVTAVVQDALFAAQYDRQINLADVAKTSPVSEALAKTVLIPRGAEWRYWDRAEEPPNNWKSLDTIEDTDEWSTGKAPLGYGHALLLTEIGFGSDKNNKQAAAFFRHEFNVDSAVTHRAVLCQLMNDDGAVVYLNGNEVFRRNMPDGDVTMKTYASTSSKPETTYWTFVIDAGQLRVGKNVLAVRVHQRSGDSSDLMHDLEAVACSSSVAKIAMDVQDRQTLVYRNFKSDSPDCIPPGANWRYLYGGAPPADWVQTDFDDQTWAAGQAPLGMGETEIKTDLSKTGEGNDGQDSVTEKTDEDTSGAGTSTIVAYFRHEFELSDEQAHKPLVGQFRFDDGAVLYINGHELLRHNLPDGPLDDSTHASKKIADENHYWTFLLKPEQLQNGKNVIALSVHQEKESNSDLFADLYLRVADERAAEIAEQIQATEKGGNQSHNYLANPNPTLIAKGSMWKYWDREEVPDKQWKTLEFDDSAWDEGKAPLGYGDPFIETQISYGGDQNKYPAAYFRHTFDASDAARVHGLVGRVLHDDSVMVFLNGEEVYRRRVPDNATKDGTYSGMAIAGPDETHYFTFFIQPGQLRAGRNILAVRVQQTGPTSSDLSMDLELSLPAAQQFVADARLRDNEAAGEIVYLEQEINVAAQAAMFAQNANSMIHLSDGEVTYHMQDGQQQTVVMDAVAQSRQYQPNAKFARALAGDTIEKLAARDELDVDKLRMLNRIRGLKTFKDREIYLKSWSYTTSASDTLTSLAKTIGVKAEELASLNDLKVDDKLQRNQLLQVPGNYKHEVSEQNSYLMLSQLQNRGQVETPYERRSVKNKIHKIKKNETLADIAQKYKITEDFLRKMNSLEPDDEYLGSRILIEYSVQPLKTSTLADIATAFGFSADDLLEVNGYTTEEEFDPSKRMQIPYGERLGLQNEARSSAQSIQVYEVVLGKKQFSKTEDKYAVPDQSLRKSADSLFDKINSAVEGVAERFADELGANEVIDGDEVIVP